MQPEFDPPLDLPRLRRDAAPRTEEAAGALPASLSELTGPVRRRRAPRDGRRPHAPARGEPLGERIIVTGRVLGSDGKPLRGQLVEIWQANAAGRYRHAVDTHDAPLDPNFTGCGRCLTDDDGAYRFTTVLPVRTRGRTTRTPGGRSTSTSSPSAAPSRNDSSPRCTSRATCFPFDPIFNSIRDERARQRLVSTFELELTQPDWALGFRFDIVLGGRGEATPLEEPHDD